MSWASAIERPFRLDVNGSAVPGVAWIPAHPSSRSPVPLVVFGHGLTHDKRSALHAPLAERLALDHGIASLAIDAPAHGERGGGTPRAPEEIWIAYREQWRRHEGADIAAEIEHAVAHVRAQHRLGAGPIGYWGLSLGTQYGLAYLARNASVRAAVLGLFGIGPRVARYAREVRCPVFFIAQREDELHPAEGVEALYELFPHPDKALVSSSGKHAEVPIGVIEQALRFMVARLEDG
jgi:fermentation-respiration switch protein FrsA (DUF1100 family)